MEEYSSITNTRTTTKELSEDCWEYILNRLALDDYQYLQSPSLVCKQFLSITNRLRHKLVAAVLYEYDNRFEANLLRALQRFRNLKEMELGGGGGGGGGGKRDTDNLIEKIASSGLDLQELAFNYLQNTPSSMESYWKLGSTMKNLKKLTCRFMDTRFQDHHLVAIADALPWLEELDIKNLGNSDIDHWRATYPQLSDEVVTDAGIEVISRKLRGLRKINISWNRGCSDRSLLALSSNCVFLNEIRCTDCSITEYGILSLLCHCPNDIISLKAGSFKSSPDSSSLAIDHSKIHARALRILCLHGSTVLDLLLCSIAKAGIPLDKLIVSSPRGDEALILHRLSTFLCACPSLKHLELREIGFLDDHSMRDLSRYLPSVESVKLRWCSNITNATFFILAKGCPRLSKIELNDIYLEAGDDFDMDVERNDRITSLCLNCNLQLNDELLKTLGALCPNLHTLDIRRCYLLTVEGIWELLLSCSKIKHLRVDPQRKMDIFLEQLKTRHIKIEYW